MHNFLNKFLIHEYGNNKYILYLRFLLIFQNSRHSVRKVESNQYDLCFSKT